MPLCPGNPLASPRKNVGAPTYPKKSPLLFVYVDGNRTLEGGIEAGKPPPPVGKAVVERWELSGLSSPSTLHNVDYRTSESVST